MSSVAGVFGISIGTETTSIVSLDVNKTPVALSFDGQTEVPTVVRVPQRADESYLFGKSAAACETNVIRSVRRLLGRLYDDPEVRMLKKSRAFPFCEIVEGRGGAAALEFVERGRTVRKLPWEILALFLERMNASMRATFGVSRTQALRCVVAVPATATHFEREDTLRAVERAGFSVERLVPESRAAVVAWTPLDGATARTVWLVVSCGAGGFEAGVLKASASSFGPHVLDVARPARVYAGGDDLDTAVVELVLDELRKAHRETYDAFFGAGTAPSAVRRNHARLRAVAKLSKEMRFSMEQDATIELGGAVVGSCVTIDVTYAAFLRKIKQRLDAFEAAMRAVVEEAQAKGLRVDGVLFVGKGGQLPALQERVRAVLGEDRVVGENGTPQTLIATGAAVARMSKLPLANGFLAPVFVGVRDGMEVATRGRRLASLTETTSRGVFATWKDLQGRMALDVVQETPDGRKRRVGTVWVENLPPLERGKVRVGMYVMHDTETLLSVVVWMKTPRCHLFRNLASEIKIDGETFCQNERREVRIACVESEFHRRRII